MSRAELVVQQYHREYQALADLYHTWADNADCITSMVFEIQADKWEDKANETAKECSIWGALGKRTGGTRYR